MVRVMLLGLVLASGCSLKSGLRVDPGKSFVLGANQHGAFKIDARNDGTVPVEISVSSDGETTPLLELEPGASATRRFRAGETALFTNPGDTTANVRVKVRGDTGLSMGYVDAR